MCSLRRYSEHFVKEIHRHSKNKRQLQIHIHFGELGELQFVHKRVQIVPQESKRDLSEENERHLVGQSLRSSPRMLECQRRLPGIC